MPLLTDEVVVLHFPSGKSTGGVAVALKREGEGARAAVALCDKGTVYSEEIGAEIATARLTTDEAFRVPGLTAALATADVVKTGQDLLAACLRENGMTVADLSVAEDAFEEPVAKPEIIYYPFTVQTERGPYSDALSFPHGKPPADEVQRQMAQRAANWLKIVSAPPVECTDEELQVRFNANVDALLDQIDVGDLSQLAEDTEARVVELATQIGERLAERCMETTGIDALDAVLKGKTP